MPPSPFTLIAPGATRGLGLALTRQILRTTDLPVFATYRGDIHETGLANKILEPIRNVDPERLNLLKLDLTSEESIECASQQLKEKLRHQGLTNPYIHTTFITGGMLVPEKRPADIDFETIRQTFQINVISHMLIIKHFSQFLPTNKDRVEYPSKWAHITARVGSIADNERGGWYSYRASKAALNQMIKTYDIQLQQSKIPAMAVGLHPGTVKTDLSKGFWDSVPREGLFEPEDAAANLVDVVENLKSSQRGKIWDWAGQEIPW
jgi:NAD(P)-dependent dehydrogenase (short-subunit alcohol dehydrogenase family)